MIVSVNPLVRLYRFPTGRRLFCLRRLLEELEGTRFRALRARVARAIAADEATHELELRWSGRKAPTEHAPEAPPLYLALGRALAALDENLASTSKAMGPGSPRGEAAARARALVFPRGVGTLTHLPYVEAGEAVRALLRRVQNEPGLQRSLVELGVQPILERVAEVNARFSKVLQPTRDPDELRYAQVQEARKAGQERLAHVVLVLAAQAVECEPAGDDAEALARALSEVYAQNDALKRHHRRGRRGTDVDPQTGSELGAAADRAQGEAASPTREWATPTREAPSPTREAASPTREAASPTREAASPTREAASPTREVASREAAPPTREAASPTREVASREAAPPTREAASPTREVASREAAPPTREAASPTRELQAEGDHAPPGRHASPAHRVYRALPRSGRDYAGALAGLGVSVARSSFSARAEGGSA